MRKLNLLFWLSLSILFSGVAQADLIFTSPPRETVEQGMKTYGPIAKGLTDLLGVTVTYQHPGNWLKYQNDMRNDKYDIVFDGPHFISWRIKHLGHQPVVTIPGKLQFFLMTGNSDRYKNFLSADDLIGKRICGIAPPNLSTLSVLDHYRNPVRQPIIEGIKGAMPKVFKAFIAKDSRCDGLILRTVFLKNKIKPEQRSQLRTLYTSQKMPNQGISVSKRVTPDMITKMQQYLTSGKSTAAIKPLLKRWAPKANGMIPASVDEFKDYNYLLEGVIWGW